MCLETGFGDQHINESKQNEITHYAFRLVYIKCNERCRIVNIEKNIIIFE